MSDRGMLQADVHLLLRLMHTHDRSDPPVARASPSPQIPEHRGSPLPARRVLVCDPATLFQISVAALWRYQFGHKAWLDDS